MASELALVCRAHAAHAFARPAVAAVARLEWVSVPATGREEYVEPEAEELEFARPVTAVYFLASTAELPFLPELVLDFPQAHDGASILQLALVRKFLGALLLPWAWVLVLPHSSADAALQLALARKFQAVLLLLWAWVLVLPGLAADGELRLALARKFLAALLLLRVWFLVFPGSAADAALSSALALLGLLGHYAKLELPSSPASPLVPELWWCWESLNEALPRASLRADLVDRACSLEALPLVKHQEECLRWESPDQVSLSYLVFSVQQRASAHRQPLPGCQSADSKKELASADLSEVDFVQQRSF
jgi:hypothetical protein